MSDIQYQHILKPFYSHNILTPLLTYLQHILLLLFRTRPMPTEIILRKVTMAIMFFPDNVKKNVLKILLACGGILYRHCSYYHHFLVVSLAFRKFHPGRTHSQKIAYVFLCTVDFV